MSRLDSTFASLRHAHRGGLVAFVTGGDPNLPKSADVIKTLADNGADAIEIGVPFSDPVADGPVIQRASERALRAGTTLTGVLELIARARASVVCPIVLFTYANPVMRLGAGAFAGQAAEAGVDGVLIVDLPVEESHDVRCALRGRGIDQVFLVSPTTSDVRLAGATACASGFLYAISRLGVTGASETVSAGSIPLVRRIRSATHLPIALGFGISEPEHVAAAVREADAAVVGSALVSVIEQAAASAELLPRVAERLRWLRTGLKGNGHDAR